MDKTFTILQIEDNPGDARLVRQYLSGASACAFELVWADSLAKGLESLESQRPDLILCDLGLPDSDGLATFLSVYEHSAGTPVIVVSGMGDRSLVCEAIRRGAQDYLVKGEMTGAALVRAIRYAIERERVAETRRAVPWARTRVLGFVGSKGGVGASTVSLNVASALAAAGRSVVLAEIRSWPGTLAYQLQTKPASTILDLAELDPFQITQNDVVLKLTELPSGIRILFGPQSWRQAKTVEPAQVDAIIRGLQGAADCIVLDILPYPPVLARPVVSGCDFVAVVTDPEPVSLDCARDLVALLADWRISRDRIGVVCVSRDAARESRPNEIRSAAGCDVLGIIPHGEPDCGAAFVDLACRLASEPVLSSFV